MAPLKQRVECEDTYWSSLGVRYGTKKYLFYQYFFFWGLNIMKMEKGFLISGSFMKTMFVSNWSNPKKAELKGQHCIWAQLSVAHLHFNPPAPCPTLTSARHSGPSSTCTLWLWLLLLQSCCCCCWSPPPLAGAAARSNAAEVKAGQTQCLGAPSPWRCQPGDGRSPSAAAKIDLLRGRAAPPPASLLLEVERLSWSRSRHPEIQPIPHQHLSGQECYHTHSDSFKAVFLHASIKTPGPDFPV